MQTRCQSGATSQRAEGSRSLCSEEGGGAANGGQLTIRCYKDSGNLVRSKMFEARATVQTVGNRRNGS
jgi:hypothetical protein